MYQRLQSLYTTPYQYYMNVCNYWCSAIAEIGKAINGRNV